jgi:hypothetical protein
MKPVFRPTLEALESRCLLSAATPPRLAHVLAGYQWGPDAPGAVLAPLEVHITHRVDRASSEYYGLGFIPGSSYVPPAATLAPALADGVVDPAVLRTQLERLEAKLTRLLAKYTAEAAVAHRRFKYDSGIFDVKGQTKFEKAAAVAASRRKAVAVELKAVGKVLAKPNDQLDAATLALVGRTLNLLKTEQGGLEGATAAANLLRAAGADAYAQGDADVA